MRAQRALAILAAGGLLAPLFASLPAAAVPGEVSIIIVTTDLFLNVNNTGNYPANFTFPVRVFVQSTGLRSFTVTIQFTYAVKLADSEDAAAGWNASGPSSLSYQVPPRGSVGGTLVVNGSVEANGSANNETRLFVAYSAQSNAPLIANGAGAINVPMFLADAPKGSDSAGAVGGGLPVSAVTGAAALAVGAGLLVAGVVFLRRGGKRVPGAKVVKRVWQRARALGLRR